MIVIGGQFTVRIRRSYLKYAEMQCENTYYIQTLVDLDIRAYFNLFVM